MKKINDLNSLLKYVFSANRRAKAFILLKEHLLGLKLIGEKTSNFELEREVESTVHRWTTHESRKADANFYKKATVKMAKDHIHEDGIIYLDQAYELHELYGAKTYTNESTHRSIFSINDERIDIVSSTRPGAPTSAPSKRRIPINNKVSGVTANLYGNIASSEGNYFHWFFDAMARLFLIEKYHSLDAIDRVLVPPLKYDFHWDTLAALGFDHSKIIELQPLDCWQFECLLATSAPRGRDSTICPGWIIDRYKETMLPHAKNVASVAGKKVYVSRRDAPNRMFLNENELCDFLDKRGFDIVELTPLNVWQKIAVFRDAELIVSQTGAGLANLTFCNSNTKTLELVDERFVYPAYASLAVYAGGLHKAHFFKDDGMLAKSNAMVAKTSLDLDKFEHALDLFEKTTF